MQLLRVELQFNPTVIVVPFRILIEAEKTTETFFDPLLMGPSHRGLLISRLQFLLTTS